MKDQISLVVALHRLDAKIQGHRAGIEKLQPGVKELEALVATHRVTRDEKTAKLAETEKAKRSKEVEVETSEARLKDFQTKLSQIKTNKEYQAALKEITETKKINKQMEDQILVLMSEIDTLKQDLQSVEEALSAAAVNLEKKRGETAAEEAKLEEAIGKETQEREAVAAKIDSGFFSQYERVRKAGREAVASVVAGTCQGCRLKIPPQLYIEIQKLKTIYACPSCHRLMYLPEWLEGAAEQKPQEEKI